MARSDWAGGDGRWKRRDNHTEVRQNLKGGFDLYRRRLALRLVRRFRAAEAAMDYADKHYPMEKTNAEK